jgi:hypothetical protein
MAGKTAGAWAILMEPTSSDQTSTTFPTNNSLKLVTWQFGWLKK